MNRIVTFGLASFFSLIGICLVGSPKQAKAFHGWPLCSGWSCHSWHPWHGSQRCYSSCGGCWGGCQGASNCCAVSGCSGYSGCSGCWGSSRCFGYSGYGSCHGAVYSSCSGCGGGGCGGYYPAAVPMIVVPVEPAPPANSAPANPPTSKSTLRVYPSIDGISSDFAEERTVWIGGSSVDDFAVEAR